MSHHALFEEHRALLFSIAYRMLGSTMEAEDIVQDVFLRFRQVELETIQSPKYYLTTITTRLCINQMNSAKQKRETYLGEWLPEPILTNHYQMLNPAERASTYESISMAFLVMLERLSPAERAVFLLREIFDYEYEDIAGIVDKSESACRQIFSRAKKHIQDHRPRFDSQPQQHQALLSQFIATIEKGDMSGLVNLLAEDVTLIPDGGGTRGAAIHILRGHHAVAQFVIASQRLMSADMTFALEEVNGQLALVIRFADGRPFNVVLIDSLEGKIHCIYTIAGETNLRGLRL